MVVYSLLLEVKMQLFKKRRGREAERQRGREAERFNFSKGRGRREVYVFPKLVLMQFVIGSPIAVCDRQAGGNALVSGSTLGLLKS